MSSVEGLLCCKCASMIFRMLNWSSDNAGALLTRMWMKSSLLAHDLVNGRKLEPSKNSVSFLEKLEVGTVR